MNLMELLPEYYIGNTTMEKLQGLLTKDVNKLVSNTNETINECFVNTASKLLSRYEKIYGLEIDVTKSDEFRRERIKAKIRGVGTVTKQMLIDTSAAYSNGKVEVIENPANYSFIIKFVGTLGVPQNMADLILTIEEVKPAHLSYTFEYVFNTYAALSKFTNSKLSEYTYLQLREEEIK